MGESLRELERGTKRSTPLPKFQLLVLLLIQLAEPVTSSVIYPFINQLIRELGVTRGDDKKTGYYAGIVESVFFAAEALTVLQWGRASDRIGRKPILLAGMFGLVIAMLSFGISNTFWAIILSRCAQGICNGNIGVTKVVMAEITDSSNRPQALSLIPLMWLSGITMGPIIGGILSHPDQWDSALISSEFFSTYPYFLPCLVAAMVPMVAFVLASMCLEETLQTSPQQEKNVTCESSLVDSIHAKSTSYGAIDPRNTSFEEPRTQQFAADSNSERLFTPSLPASSSPTHEPFSRTLLTPEIFHIVFNYAFLAFFDGCFQVLQPLMYTTSIPLGGLQFTPFQTGVIMGSWGLFNGVVQLFTFTKVRKRLGQRKTYQLGIASQIILMGLFPVMSFQARRAERVDGLTAAMVGLQLFFATSQAMSYACMFMYINDAAPSRDTLGAMNGLAQMVASTMRTLAPTIASSLFSLSLQKQLVGGYAVYLILMACSVLSLIASSWLPKALKE